MKKEKGRLRNRPFEREEDKNDNCRSQQFCSNATSKNVLTLLANLSIIRNDGKQLEMMKIMKNY